MLHPILTHSPAPVLLLALILATVAFAGCHDLGATTQEHDTRDDPQDEDPPVDEESDGDDPTNGEEDAPRNETPPPRRRDLELELSSVAGPVFPGDALELDVAIDGDNTSADWAGIRWSLESTADRDLEELGPAVFSGGHSTEDENLSTGYTVHGWSPASAETHYLRAHLEADGFHYWSPEVVVDVTPAVEEGDFDVNDTIRMRTNLLEPCDGDNYSVESLQIAVGEVVEWVNAASCPHTATHDAGDPLWDTGDMEPNQSSTGYRFNRPGTYVYRCTYHPDMRAQIVVE